MPLTTQMKHLSPDIVVLEMAGSITMGNDCLQVEWQAKQALAEKQNKLIFDLGHVTHVDSTGIGIIVVVAGRMKEAGGNLRLAGCNGHVEKMLRLTSIDKIVPLYVDVDGAAKDF